MATFVGTAPTRNPGFSTASSPPLPFPSESVYSVLWYKYPVSAKSTPQEIVESERIGFSFNPPRSAPKRKSAVGGIHVSFLVSHEDASGFRPPRRRVLG